MGRPNKASLVARVVGKLESPFNFRVYAIVRQSLAFSLDDMEIPSGLTVREATPADLDAAARRSELDISYEFLELARQRGDRCFAAFQDGEMVAYTWRTSSWAPHESVGVWVFPPYVYGYKGMTLPSHRGLRLNAIVNRRANEAYRSGGYTHYVGFASPYNQASLNAMKQEYGYERMGYAAYGTWLGKFWLFRTRMVKATGLRFGPPQT